MGEKTGFMGVLIILAVGVIPFLFNLFDTQVKTNKLMSLSNEVQQLVVAEGDITPTVRSVVNGFKEKGINIEFRDKNGNIIHSSPGIGEKLYIHYEYDGFKMKNSVILTKR